MKRAPVVLALLGLVVVLGTTNFTIWRHQQVIDTGQTVFLDLRPVDPRSLIQGDYMDLRYAQTVFPPTDQRNQLPPRGVFVVMLDEHNVASFSRLDDGTDLDDNETRLKYKQIDQSGQIRLGAESFLFQEGQAQLFNDARYGVLRVDAAGNSVLVGLADENWQIIREPDEAQDSQ